MSVIATIPGYGSFTVTTKALKGISTMGGTLHCAVDAKGCREHGITFSPQDDTSGTRVELQRTIMKASTTDAPHPGAAAAHAARYAYKAARKTVRENLTAHKLVVKNLQREIERTASGKQKKTRRRELHAIEKAFQKQVRHDEKMLKQLRAAFKVSTKQFKDLKPRGETRLKYQPLDFSITVAEPLAPALNGAILDFAAKGKRARFRWLELDVPRNRRCGCGRSIGAPLGKRGKCMKSSGVDCSACPMTILRKL